MKPWTVEIVGRESGDTFELPFVRFWTQQKADLWCIAMNAADRCVRGFPEEKSLTFFRSKRVR